MSEIVGIICEYNPFHKGHLYQINQIKKELPNSKIVAIMSGNIVQRGEFAIFDKRKRAELSLENGVDLVLEIPYPYCGSTAEVFANAGVRIATKIGCSHLYFGTETADIGDLEKLSSIIDSKEMKNAINKHLVSSKNYNEAKEKALKENGFTMPKAPNDILALEYIRAIKNQESHLEYRTIKRKGAGYNDREVQDVMSASAIRKYYYENNEFISIPNTSQSFYERIAMSNQTLDLNKTTDFLHRYALIVEREELDSAYDSCAEIGAVIKNSAENSRNGEHFITSLSSKAYTTARIKRALLFALFKVKSADKCLNFTNLLATNDNGKKILKLAKKEDFVVVTKLSDTKKLDPVSKKHYDSTISVDKIYNTLLKDTVLPSEAYSQKPTIK
ncbi:MAG: nucleotidyltransferase family protein [Clostridia bacterium]|nr:nucleotidyltransferase family protein [Clostridia bacterium]